MTTEKKHASVEEFKVKTLEFGGFVGAFTALHLPFGGKVKSKIAFLDYPWSWGGVGYESRFAPSDDDIRLVKTLVKRGDEHAKILRGITVWAEITAPRYFWQEMDRYSVGACCLGSNSTMHQQGQGLSEDDLIEMKENLPEGTMQTRVWSFTYQTLRRIYFQRHKHRLPQWRKFCEWITSLPFSNVFILPEESVAAASSLTTVKPVLSEKELQDATVLAGESYRRPEKFLNKNGKHSDNTDE